MEDIQKLTIEQIIAKFDSPDTTIEAYSVISGRLEADTSEEEKKRPEYLFEFFAFDVMEYTDVENPWGANLFFGPLYTFTKPDGVYQRPNKDIATKDAVVYWNKRKDEVSNAMLKARYVGLVWDYADLAEIKKDGALLRLYCDALCEIAERSLTGDLWICQRYLRRAFDLSKKLKDVNDKVKLLYSKLGSKASDGAIGVWGVYYRLFVDNPKQFDGAETTQILQEANERLARLVEKEKSGADGVNRDIVSQMVEILASYYVKAKDSVSRDRVLNIADQTIRRSIEGESASFRFYSIQSLKALYNKFGNHDHDDALIVEMQELGKAMIDEMEHHQFEIEIPKEQWDAMHKQMTEGDIEYQRALFVYQFITKKKDLEDRMTKEAEQHPLAYMLQNQLISHSGLPLSVVGGVENDKEGRLIQYAAQHIELESVILQSVIDWHFASGVFSVDYIMEHVKAVQYMKSAVMR